MPVDPIPVGFECKSYRDTNNTWGGPAWSEMGDVKDINFRGARAKVNVSRRGRRPFNRNRVGLADWTVTIDIFIPSSFPQEVSVLEGAFEDATTLNMVFLSGDIATTGSNGPHAEWIITGFDVKQTLEEGVMASMTLEIGDTDNDPEWMVI